jgi:hypothetical protein
MWKEARNFFSKILKSLQFIGRMLWTRKQFILCMKFFISCFPLENTVHLSATTLTRSLCEWIPSSLQRKFLLQELPFQLWKNYQEINISVLDLQCVRMEVLLQHISFGQANGLPLNCIPSLVMEWQWWQMEMDGKIERPLFQWSQHSWKRWMCTDLQ